VVVGADLRHEEDGTAIWDSTTFAMTSSLPTPARPFWCVGVLVNLSSNDAATRGY
jgi:hypothetical protein